MSKEARKKNLVPQSGIIIGTPALYGISILGTYLVKRSGIVQTLFYPIFNRLGIEMKHVPAFAILDMALLTYVLTSYANNIVQSSEKGIGVDNSVPREGRAQATGLALRAQSAHANQVETFPLIAVAAWISSEAGVPLERRALSLTYICLLRYAHAVTYYADLDLVRSISWLSVVYESLSLIAAAAF